MNISLEPHQWVAHWVPGFILLSLYPVLMPDFYAQASAHLLPTDALFRGFIWVVLPFASGQLIDCFRNSVLEDCMDKRWQEVNWDFFFKADKEKLEKLRRSFFDYYVFDINLAIPSFFFSLWRLVEWIWGPWHWVQCICGLGITFLLVWDARSLRIEIAKHTKSLSSAGSNQSA